MLHFVVDLIDQRIPILDLPIALLVEVGRQRYVVKEHGVDVEGIVRTDERKDARGPMPGPTFVDGEAEGLLGLPLALLDVGLLPVKGCARHDYTYTYWRYNGRVGIPNCAAETDGGAGVASGERAKCVFR